MCDGMPAMTHRTTFALDQDTAKRLKRLASKWDVSQAEVVRRSVERAEKEGEASKPDPIALLHQLHEKGGGITPSEARKWIAEIRENRKHWRGK
jgi:predicted transcriptional regulator